MFCRVCLCSLCASRQVDFSVLSDPFRVFQRLSRRALTIQLKRTLALGPAFSPGEKEHHSTALETVTECRAVFPDGNKLLLFFRLRFASTLTAFNTAPKPGGGGVGSG